MEEGRHERMHGGRLWGLNQARCSDLLNQERCSVKGLESSALFSEGRKRLTSRLTDALADGREG